MNARDLAAAVVVIHAAFLAFVILGAALVVRRPRWAWLHLPALAWGLWIEFSHGRCPLTPLENALRARAGDAGYAGGFVDHYLVPLIYPPGLKPGDQLLLGIALAAWNLVLYGAAILRQRRRVARRAH